jgi:hypothetical protein
VPRQNAKSPPAKAADRLLAWALVDRDNRRA